MPLPVSERVSLDGEKKSELVKQIHEQARKNIEDKTKLYTKHANKGRRQVVFQEGDLVWVHLRKERFPAERKSKLMPRVDGPFKIIRRISPNAYQLDLQGKYNVSSSFNVSDLVPFIADEADLRSNPFQEGEDDMIMESKDEPEHEPEHEPELVAADAKLVPEDTLGKDVLAVPRGPMTRARAKLFNEAIGGMLRHLSMEQEDMAYQTTLVSIQAI